LFECAWVEILKELFDLTKGVLRTRGRLSEGRRQTKLFRRGGWGNELTSRWGLWDRRLDGSRGVEASPSSWRISRRNALSFNPVGRANHVTN